MADERFAAGQNPDVGRLQGADHADAGPVSSAISRSADDCGMLYLEALHGRAIPPL